MVNSIFRDRGVSIPILVIERVQSNFIDRGVVHSNFRFRSVFHTLLEIECGAFSNLRNLVWYIPIIGIEVWSIPILVIEV